MFKQRFGFTIASEVQLNTSKKPQGALNHAITELVANHDGPNKLLIVYYTGHGMLVGPAGDQDLELTAYATSVDLLSLQLTASSTDNVQKNSQGTYAATARWAKAETSLLDDATEADVLVILDCCFASNAHKGHTDNSRIYELLAACPKGEQTPAPGPNSFTRRLINTLKNNLEGPKDQRILTTKLVTTMNKQAKTPAKLHDRLFKEDGRHVQLTPIDKQPSKNTKQDVTPRPPELSGVKLRFSLREHELTQDKIEAWAQELLKACKTADIAIRQIDWIKMTKMEGRLARGIFRHAVKEMIRDQRRKSLTDDSLHEDTSSLGKRHLSDDSISSPAKRLAFIADLTPEAQDVSGLLTPRSNLG